MQCRLGIQEGHGSQGDDKAEPGMRVAAAEAAKPQPARGNEAAIVIPIQNLARDLEVRAPALVEQPQSRELPKLDVFRKRSLVP